MKYLLCRNRVKDYEKWKGIFDSHQVPQEESGLLMQKMWRDLEDPNNIFFIFEVFDIEKAKVFINHPEAAKAGEESGVLDGECTFVEEIS